MYMGEKECITIHLVHTHTHVPAGGAGVLFLSQELYIVCEILQEFKLA